MSFRRAFNSSRTGMIPVWSANLTRRIAVRFNSLIPSVLHGGRHRQWRSVINRKGQYAVPPSWEALASVPWRSLSSFASAYRTVRLGRNDELSGAFPGLPASIRHVKRLPIKPPSRQTNGRVPRATDARKKSGHARLEPRLRPQEAPSNRSLEHESDLRISAM